MGSRAFWAVVFGFLFGVFARSFLLIGWSCIGLLALLGVVAVVFAFLSARNSQRYILFALALFACAIGVGRMQLAVVSGDPNVTEAIGKSVSIQGVVTQEPDARDTATLVSLDVSSLAVGSANIPVRAGILAELPAHARIAYGDQVQISGMLKLPASFGTGDGQQFDYPEYLAAQGIEYQLGYAKIDSINRNSGEPLQGFAISVKENFLRGLGLVMPDPEAALAGGITVGDKRSIGPQLTQDFQRDSLVHMVVLSGYNITVVLSAISKLLTWAPRSAQFAGSVVVVIFFVFMTGGASSALRAGLMALIAVLARATHRVYLGERVLAFVSLAMVAWNPWTLCFDPSFQLSALATLGLILFTPTFAQFFRRVPEAFGAREILSSTCATQLMVLPLLLQQSGAASLVALPANLLALLPVPWAMFFSLIAGIAGVLFGSSAAIAAFPAYALLWYVIVISHALAALPFAAVSVPGFSAAWMAAAYAVLFGGFAYMQKQSGSFSGRIEA